MQTKLKILHIIVAGQIGGAERFLVNLASRADASWAEHCIALMTPNPKLRDFFVTSGLKVRERGLVRENPLAYLWRSWGPRDLHWLGQVIAEEGADLLHCHTYGSHVLSARAGEHFSVPVIRTEHGVRHYADPSCALFRHWALKHTTHIVGVSGFVAERVLSIAPYMKGRVSVIHNGIDLDYFTPQPPPMDGPFRLAVVSRLEPIKRLSLAVEAIAKLPDVHLDIAGDGVERAKLAALANAFGVESRIRFLGHQPDPRPVIAACDAVLNCTRDEGLSLSLIEAGAMARPAIGFAAGGVPEAVEDGKTGWLGCDQTAEGLAGLIKMAAADRSETAKRGLNARLRAETRFGINTMCEGYGAVYRDVLRGFPRHKR